jgi:Ran GTPase-activating protein (RanGAP) involved in mRNA processing and transport
VVPLLTLLCCNPLQNLGDEGTAYVIEALAFNNTCLAVDLSQNGIGAMGTGHLCETISTSAVQTLVLSTNSIGDDGCEALATMLGGKLACSDTLVIVPFPVTWKGMYECIQ